MKVTKVKISNDQFGNPVVGYRVEGDPKTPGVGRILTQEQINHFKGLGHTIELVSRFKNSGKRKK